MKERNSIANAIRRRIEHGPPGRLSTFDDFRSFPPMAVAAALSRLAKKGAIRRLSKGVYCRPKESRFGTILPEGPSVVAAVLKRRGIGWKASGLPAYNALGLTTQVSPITVLDVDRPVSPSTGLNLGVRFRVVREVRRIGEKERVVLDALRDIKSIPDTSPNIVLSRIVSLFRSGEVSFADSLHAALKEPPRVRALMGCIGSTLGKRPNFLKPLRDSLNSMTTFKLGIGDSLPAARDWGVR